MNDKDKIKSFWDTKEKETNSKLIIATSAQYIYGYNNIQGPINGLLYLMTKGFYFENFEDKNWFKELLVKSTNFKKINFFIALDKIINITDILGNNTKHKLSLMAKLKKIISLYPRELRITYKNNNDKEEQLMFITLEDPLVICDKYNNLKF